LTQNHPQSILEKEDILLDFFGVDSTAEKHHVEVPQAIVFPHQLPIDLEI